MPLEMSVAFLLVLGICAFLILVRVIYLHKRQSRMIRRAVDRSPEYAKNVAKSLWYVEGDPENTKDGIMMRFRHYSFGSRRFRLPVRSSHPDIKEFLQLTDGDTVEFEALAEGLEGTLKFEVCGYLRLRNIS